MSRLPNILIFNPDQWRGDVLGHMGNPAAVTPNLDRMVEKDAVSFSGAVCHNACCTASRAAFFTGWYPHVRGHRTMSYMLQPDEPMLLKTLKDNGYFVWWGGKNDVVPAENGFEDYCDIKYEIPESEKQKVETRPADPDWRGEKGGDNFFSFLVGKMEGGDALKGETTNYDWAMIRGALDFIQNYDGDKPFCIFMPILYPHPPYLAEEPWFSMIDRAKVPPRAPVPSDPDLEPAFYGEMRGRLGMNEWTDERWQELRATYYASCARVDHQFGMVLDALREKNVYDDTAVFFFADHGDLTGDYDTVQKIDNVFPDCLCRVPLVVKPPAGVPVQVGVSDALVELIDVPATIEAITGIGPKHDHFGRSLLPVISGKTEDHRDAVFAEGGRRYGEESCKGNELVDEPFDENLYWPTLLTYRSEVPAVGKAVMVRTKTHKYVRRLYETDELYDLEKDPQEVSNVINDPAYADILKSLQDRLLTFYLETGDVVPRKVNAREANPGDIQRVRHYNEECDVE